MSNNIIILDDDEAVASALAWFFQAAGFESLIYSDVTLFLQEMQQHDPLCVFLDVRMPLLNGFEVYQKIREAKKTYPVLFLTGHASKADVDQFGDDPNAYFLTKPVKNEALLVLLQEFQSAALDRS